MSLFGFFHKKEKDPLKAALKKRKRNVLSTVKSLASTGNRMKSYAHLESMYLQQVSELAPQERAAISRVLKDERTEEQILDYLATIERKIIIAVEEGNSAQLKIKLAQYVKIMQGLENRIEQLELSKTTQLARIKEEEERVNAELRLKNSTEAKRHNAALRLMKKALKAQSKENQLARKKFYKNMTQIGTNVASLVESLIHITADAAKFASKKVNKSLKK